MKSICGLILATLLLGACAKPKDLEFVDVRNIKMIRWGLQESLVGLEVRFYNPNNQRVRLRDAEAKVYADSTYLGDTRMDSTIFVPKKDTFSIPLVMRVQTATAMSRIVQTLSDSTISVRVQGSVKMGKGGVFMTYPINFEKKQKVSELNF